MMKKLLLLLSVCSVSWFIHVGKTLAEDHLRTPNCDNPQSNEEGYCCDAPQQCETYGFESPPLRTPNCDNPQTSPERKCCVTPHRCEAYGFEQPAAQPPPADTASDGASEPAARTPSDPAQSNAKPSQEFCDQVADDLNQQGKTTGGFTDIEGCRCVKNAKRRVMACSAPAR